MTNIEVVGDITSFRKCTKLIEIILELGESKARSWGFKLFCKAIFVMNKNSNLKPMLHNIALQASKPQNLSLIRRLHLLLSYYPFDSSFIQDNFPLMAQRHHCHLHKASFMQSQLALSFALVPFCTNFLYKVR